MIYLANPTGDPTVHAAMSAGLLGYMDTPGQGNRRPAGVTWAADNGCYGSGYPGDEPWLAWLAKNRGAAASCLFASAPDVVGDAVATFTRSAPFLPRIRALGFRAALVAQDGLEDIPVPWNEFDVLFVGGSTVWKLGRAARQVVGEARRRGVPVHMGRVNTRGRIAYAASIGCDSVDGTYLKFGPSVNLPKLLRWLDKHNRPALPMEVHR